MFDRAILTNQTQAKFGAVLQRRRSRADNVLSASGAQQRDPTLHPKALDDCRHKPGIAAVERNEGWRAEIKGSACPLVVAHELVGGMHADPGAHTTPESQKPVA